MNCLDSPLTRGQEATKGEGGYDEQFLAIGEAVVYGVGNGSIGYAVREAYWEVMGKGSVCGYWFYGVGMQGVKGVDGLDGLGVHALYLSGLWCLDGGGNLMVTWRHDELCVLILGPRR